jgi:hypothetical protein
MVVKDSDHVETLIAVNPVQEQMTSPTSLAGHMKRPQSGNQLIMRPAITGKGIRSQFHGRLF